MCYWQNLPQDLEDGDFVLEPEEEQQQQGRAAAAPAGELWQRAVLQSWCFVNWLCIVLSARVSAALQREVLLEGAGSLPAMLVL